MNITTKILTGVVLTGSIIVGALTYTGSADLQAVYNKFNETVQKLNVFEDNENKLVNKVTDLKTSVSGLEKQLEDAIASGNASLEEITTLKANITALNSQISELTATNNSNVEQANAEINKANAEIEKANKEIKDLKDYIESVTTPTASNITEVLK